MIVDTSRSALEGKALALELVQTTLAELAPTDAFVVLASDVAGTAQTPGSGAATPDAVARAVARRRPEVDPREVVPTGVDGLRAQIERFIAVGASKFVVVPVDDPADWSA